MELDGEGSVIVDVLVNWSDELLGYSLAEELSEEEAVVEPVAALVVPPVLYVEEDDGAEMV